MKHTTLLLQQPLNKYTASTPYQLSTTGDAANAFYQRLETFTAEVLNEGHVCFDQIIQHYRCSAAYLGNDFKQTSHENVLDILIMGVLWNQYKGKWGRAIVLKKAVFNALYAVRTNNATLKPYADKVRGRLTPVLDNAVDEEVIMNVENLQRLSMWLSATGDFNEEVLRINSWIRFLKNKPESLDHIFLIHVERFALWFQDEAKAALGSYTKGTGHFLSSQKQKYHGKENYFFTGRSEVEYHLNMVGAAIMNLSMRNDFHSTQKQVLLLPMCMANNENCKSKEQGLVRVCVNCTKTCNISRASQQLNEHGVQTIIIKHSSSFSQVLEQWANQKEVGLIGTACTLNLLMGGFEMKRLNIPAQCVFLNYSGCKKHWDTTGIATQIDIEQVKELVAFKNHGRFVAS